jgi:acyl-coenzyme A thioesterase PaaI-like protein
MGSGELPTGTFIAVRPVSTTPPADAVIPAPHPDAPAPGTKLGSHYSKCFGCGEDAEGGLRVQTTVGDGVSVTAEFLVTENHQGAPGLAHGGLLALAFDEALGSVNWLLHLVAVTGRLETDYLRPVPVGTTLFIEARCNGVSGRKIYLSAVGRLGGPDGEIAVRATAIFISVGVEHFLANGRPAEVRAAMADPDQLRAARAFEVNP